MTPIATLTTKLFDADVTIEVYNGKVRAQFKKGNTLYDGGNFLDIDTAFWWAFEKALSLTERERKK